MGEKLKGLFEKVFTKTIRKLWKGVCNFMSVERKFQRLNFIFGLLARKQQNSLKCAYISPQRLMTGVVPVNTGGFLYL